MTGSSSVGHTVVKQLQREKSVSYWTGSDSTSLFSRNVFSQLYITLVSGEKRDEKAGEMSRNVADTFLI